MPHGKLRRRPSRPPHAIAQPPSPFKRSGAAPYGFCRLNTIHGITINLHAAPSVGLASDGFRPLNEQSFQRGDVLVCRDHVPFHDSLPAASFVVEGDAHLKVMLIDNLGERQGLATLGEGEAEVDDSRLGEIIARRKHAAEDIPVVVVGEGRSHTFRMSPHRVCPLRPKEFGLVRDGPAISRSATPCKAAAGSRAVVIDGRNYLNVQCLAQ
jgi:hypothetical protein